MTRSCSPPRKAPARQAHRRHHPDERQGHHRRRQLLDRAGRRRSRGPHHRGRHQSEHHAAGGSEHASHRPPGQVGRPRDDRQPRALPGGRRLLDARAAVRRRRLAQAGARDDPRQGPDRRARQVGVQPRWLVTRPVRGRQEAIHARRTGQGVPEQPRVPPVHALGAVPQ